MITMFLRLTLALLFCFEITANPVNLTCSPTDTTNHYITVRCLVDPGGRLVNINYNNKTYPLGKHGDIIYSSCSTTAPDIDHLYPTKKCDIDIDLTYLRPGYNYIYVTASPYVADTNFTITSNTIIIHAYGDLQQPTCGPPTFVVEGLFRGKYIHYDCVAPLSLTDDVECQLKSRTNGNLISTVDTEDKRRVLDTNKTVVDICRFEVSASRLGVGQLEFQGAMSGKNDEGEKITVLSNWSSPLNIYPATEMNFTVNGSTDKVVVLVGQQIIFNCKVNGFYPSEITLRQDKLWSKTFDWSPMNTAAIYSTVIDSCSQADVYTCSSLGVLGETFNKNVTVNIPCQLQLRSERNSQSKSFSLGTFINTNAVKIEVFGYPGPRTMRLSNLPKSFNTSVHIVYTQEQGPYGTIDIQFNTTKIIRDIQYFQVDVDNGVGNTSFSFYIQDTSMTSTYGSTTSIWLTIICIMSCFFFFN